MLRRLEKNGALPIETGELVGVNLGHLKECDTEAYHKET